MSLHRNAVSRVVSARETDSVVRWTVTDNPRSTRLRVFLLSLTRSDMDGSECFPRALAEQADTGRVTRSHASASIKNYPRSCESENSVEPSVTVISPESDRPA